MRDAMATTSLLRGETLNSFAHPTSREIPVVGVDRYLSSLFGVVTALKAGTCNPQTSPNFEWQSTMMDRPRKFSARSIDYEVSLVLAGYGYALSNAAIDLANPLQSLEEPPHAEERNKEVMTFFRRSAGVFEWLAANPLVSPELQRAFPPGQRPPELSATFAEAMAMIVLGEAQVLAVQRGRQKGTSPVLLAKLASGAASKFDQARFKMQTEAQADWDATAAPFKEYVQACFLHMRALAYRFMGLAAQAEERWGEAVGYLRVAARTTVPVAEMHVPDHVATAIAGEQRETRRLLEQAVHDNDSIYFGKEVAEEALRPPEPMAFVRSIAFPCPAPAFTEIK
ncbi:putative BRO1-like domain [Paratrimastix pyriformis]|uniref:BRO1-like domain n=1 Tax=Paratrimastix pyriformis TaxID=342808 RepID=A0ABQ8UWQ6_9EUKA|nr:putative BRO1-like domain [Paratrimastix pyriformis]